jgi:hypothetical protein
VSKPLFASIDAWADCTIPMLDDHEWRCILPELDDDMGPALDVEQYDAILRALDRLGEALESGNNPHAFARLAQWANASPPRAIDAGLHWTAQQLGIVDFHGWTPRGRALMERRRQQSTDGGAEA